MKTAWLSSILLVLSMVCRAGAAPEPTAGGRPIPEIRRVVIVSIDGLRPDRLLLAETPHLRALIRGGSYTFWATTTVAATTLPSHVSMLTGVEPRKHKIEWNETLPLSEPFYPRFPTLFAIAHEAGYTTAMVGGKAKFSFLAAPGTLDHVRLPEKDEATDDAVGAAAVQTIEKTRPHVLFVHFPAVDAAGHAWGWGSPEQMKAIEQADALIGRIVATLEKEGLRKETLLLITADHGGAGKSHGPEDARSRHIPWIVNGPGVRRFADLTQDAGLHVRIEDTCATAAWALGLPLDPKWDGTPVRAAFEQTATP